MTYKTKKKRGNLGGTALGLLASMLLFGVILYFDIALKNAVGGALHQGNTLIIAFMLGTAFYVLNSAIHYLLGGFNPLKGRGGLLAKVLGVFWAILSYFLVVFWSQPVKVFLLSVAGMDAANPLSFVVFAFGGLLIQIAILVTSLLIALFTVT